MCRAQGERLRAGDLASLLSRLVGFILSVGVQVAVSDIKFRPRRGFVPVCPSIRLCVCPSVGPPGLHQIPRPLPDPPPPHSR